MTGTYDPVLVVLSYLMAAIASYVALALASRVSAAQGRAATLWLLGGAVAMGIGIWSMHFVGMLAFHLPIPTSYDIPITLLSLLIAVLLSEFALFTFSRKALSPGWLVTAGTVMGIGIAAMHYSGMAALRMSPPITFDPKLFALSLVVAIGASILALWIGYRLRQGSRPGLAWTRVASALVMGAAISGMHYTGMSAALFDADSVCLAGPQQINNVWLAMTVACCAVLLLAGTILIRIGDRTGASDARYAMSLRLQITAGFLVTVVLSACVVVASLWVQFDGARNASVLEARTLANAIAVANVAAIDDARPLQLKLANLHHNENRDIFVVDLNGRILADTDPSEIGTRFEGDRANALGKTMVDGLPRTFEEIVQSPRHVTLQVAVAMRKDPLDTRSPIVGAVVVEYTPMYELLQKEAWAMAKVVGALGVGVIFLGSMLAIRAASAIASPLIALKRGAVALAGGDYATRVEIRSKDEIGELAAAFNRMAEDLSASHSEVIRHGQELEAHVESRTIEWQRAKEVAEASAAELHLITDLMPVSLCYVDRDRRLRYHNRMFAQWAGYAAKQVDGRMLAEVIGPDAYAIAEEWIDQALSGRPVSYDWRYSTRDGEVQTITTHLMPHLDNDGEVAGCYAMSQDISVRKEAEEALRLRNDELKQINRRLHEARDQLLQAEKMASIGQLASGVAHEINNPIGYVHSNLRTLDHYLANLFRLLDTYQAAEGAIGDEATRRGVQAATEAADLDFVKVDLLALLAESKEGVTRVTKIVQDLKNFSRSASDESWQWADIHEGIDSTLNIVWNELKYKAEVKKQYGELPRIQCRPSQLNQVFMNLLVNGAHAIKSRGAITIRTGVDGADAWIEIEDTGEGIKPENLSRIFDPFFTTKPVGKGTGLGLSVSYGIVTDHHGRIDVHSEPGKGSVFRVWIPLRQLAVDDDVAPIEDAAELPDRSMDPAVS